MKTCISVLPPVPKRGMIGGTAGRMLRSFAATLGVCAAIFFAHTGPAAAQVQTYKPGF
jgi:hypothetical protein